jgi:hypothetical protein
MAVKNPRQFWLIMLMLQLRIERRPVSDGRVQPEPIIFDNSWTAADLKTALRPLAIFLKDSTRPL